MAGGRLGERLRRDRFFQLGLVLVAAVVAAALLAPWLAPFDPPAGDLRNAYLLGPGTLGIAGAIMAEAALSFVGLGAQAPTPSWGSMVADGRDLLRVAPWVSFAPGIAIGLAVLGFNLVGDVLREVYDPQLRRER
jgi:ABC-type dipeptide/oligopeptide/nickel transport system permease subunit